MAINHPDYKNALITGASSGLGQGLAVWFARRGTRVFAAARRMEPLRALSEAAAASGGKIEAVSMDVADSRQTIEQIQQIDDQCGGLDLVVANAGIGGLTDGKRIAWQTVDKIIQVNVTGAAATLCAVLPRMVERNRGHLVGISSIAAWRGMRRHAGYSASKAFLAIFLEGLRVDLHSTQVRVTCIHPGFVKSEMTAKNKFKMPFLLETEDAVERMGKAILRAESEFSFPWQTSAAMRAIRLLPNRIFDSAARKLG